VWTGKNIFPVTLLLATSFAQLIDAVTARTTAVKTITSTAHETKAPKKAAPSYDSNTLGIVTGDRNSTEFASAEELVTLIATGQETGPHGEVVLGVAPILGNGGFQNIHDVLTLADADMSIVPLPLLDQAPAALGIDNLRKYIVYIAPLFEEEFHLLARWSIGNVSDLAGQTVNLGPKGSAVDVLGREIFDRLGVKVNVINLDHSDARNAMRKGELEADLTLSGKPVGSLASYKLGDEFRLIEIPRLAAFAKNFLPATLTHNDYPNQIPLGNNVDSIGVRSVLIAYNWPRDSDRYRLLNLFVRTLFSRFWELEVGRHHPKWQEVNLARSVAGWTQFPPAQRWLDQQALESFLSERGIDAPADRARLLEDILRLRR
jgi:TRAP-type uncharacterized transport system substrate-binding protein